MSYGALNLTANYIWAMANDAGVVDLRARANRQQLTAGCRAT